MYRLLGVSVVLFISGYVSGKSAIECPTASSSTTAYRLRSQLLCDYDSMLRPVKDHRNATTVSFTFLLKYFEYDHFTHTLSVDTWVSTYWNDDHLKWNPDDFEGIKNIHLSSTYDLWVPDISVYNRKDQSSDPKIIGETTCSVNFRGTVFCVPPLHFDALCVPNLRTYPYDTQNCTVRIGSWVHKGEEVIIKPYGRAVATEDLESNGEWDLIGYTTVLHRGNYSCCPNSTYPSMDVIFEIRRNGHTHAVNVILPLFVCMLLTITTLFMSPLRKERFIIGCVSLIGHIIHVQNVSYTIPITGENVPIILIISRDSTLLAGISIIATVLLKTLMEKASPCPGWISVVTSVLLGSRPGQMILLTDSSLKGTAASEKQEDGETIIPNGDVSSPNPFNSDWYIFARFIDISFLAIYIFFYLSYFLNLLF